MMITSRSRSLRLMMPVLVAALIVAGPAYGDDPLTLPNSVATVPEVPREAPARQKPQKRRVKEITPEQEQRIQAFVAVQHPELSTLLQRLREKDSQQYQVALSDLRTPVERLTRLQTKNPARYDAELENWKVQSRIRLLRARQSLQPEGVPESELRTWLDREVESRLRLLKLERTEQAARLARLDDVIQRTEAHRNDDVDRELKRALKKTKARPTSPRSKPATHRKASPTPATTDLGNPE